MAASKHFFPAAFFFPFTFPGEGYPRWPLFLSELLREQKSPLLPSTNAFTLVVCCQMKRGQKNKTHLYRFQPPAKRHRAPGCQSHPSFHLHKKGGEGGEGGEHLNITTQQANSDNQAFKPTYGGSNKGAAVHRRAARLCSACLMNAIIRARH